MEKKPVLGILLGDSAGVGPELVAKVAASGFLSKYCNPVIIGDARIFERGLKTIGKTVPFSIVQGDEPFSWEDGIPVLDEKNQNPDEIVMGKAQEVCGKADLQMIETGVTLYQQGKIDGFCFAPLNKAAMIMGGSRFESEHHQLAELFHVTTPYGEINVLDHLMTTRATSHIPIEKVSAELTKTAVLNSIFLLDQTMKSAGNLAPKIAVSALNPHCGENGLCGREEIDVIAPAVEQAQREGVDVSGPYSADVLFYRAFAGEFDGVVTMYHDQGQIALKLRGFERGVTVAGGMPAPITTCAHGSAYDIAGTGKVGTTSFENAVKIAVKMAQTAKNKN